MKHSTGNPTKAEKLRFDRMKQMGRCVACLQHGKYAKWSKDDGEHIEIHHLLSGNKRIGHMATISLCMWHHRGITFDYEVDDFRTMKKMTEKYGPSFANGSKPFRAEFGSDKELLELQNALLEQKYGN